MNGLGVTLAAVLGASLLGSLHCVAMCGGFVATVSGSSRADGRRAIGPLLAYQGARGFAYVSLGALAGLLGAGLDASGAMLGIQRVAGPLMAVVLIAMAIATLRGSTRHETPLISLGPPPRRSLLARLRLRLATAVRQRGATAGAAAGLLTALLPCGWLWAYVALAASTGSAGLGALLMGVFWLGSVPALFGVGLLAGQLGRRLGRHAPRITAALLLALGIASLSGKLIVTPPAPPASEQQQAEQVEPTEVPREAPCH